jgi:SAM-dependent methyltransferase
VLRIPAWLARLGLALNRRYFRQLFEAKYLHSRRPPSWFDHRIDLHYQWPDNLFWLERGFFARRYVKPGSRVLDLFSGDGFYARHFYATVAGHIDAIDKDPAAIAHAGRYHADPRITYHCRDAVRDGFPQRQYDAVIWSEGLDHLSQDEYRTLIERIKTAIGPVGVLTGGLILVPPERLGKANWEHQNEFSTPEALETWLATDFDDVQVEVTTHPEKTGGSRRTAYFTVRAPRLVECCAKPIPSDDIREEVFSA